MFNERLHRFVRVGQLMAFVKLVELVKLVKHLLTNPWPVFVGWGRWLLVLCVNERMVG